MKAIQLGQLRINLDHLVWYSPSAKNQGEKDDGTVEIAVKTTDTPQAVSVRYKTAEARDADVRRLDGIFGVEPSEPGK